MWNSRSLTSSTSNYEATLMGFDKSRLSIIILRVELFYRQILAPITKDACAHTNEPRTFPTKRQNSDTAHLH